MIAVVASRVRLVRERLEHEREAGARVAELADEALELGGRFVHAMRARLEHAGEPERPLVLRRERFPARDGLQAGLGEIDLMRDSRRALGERGLIGQQGGREVFVRGRVELLALERDVAEQRVRVDLDLRVASIGLRAGCAGREQQRDERRQKALHARQYTPGVRIGRRVSFHKSAGACLDGRRAATICAWSSSSQTSRSGSTLTCSVSCCSIGPAEPSPRSRSS